MKNMHLLIDTNIILDWLLHREPDDDSSEKIMESCIFGDNIGYLSVHSLTNLFYIIRKDMNVEKRKKLISFLHSHFNVVSETSDMVKAVIEREEWKDIEDGYQMPRTTFFSVFVKFFNWSNPVSSILREYRIIDTQQSIGAA